MFLFSSTKPHHHFLKPPTLSLHHHPHRRHFLLHPAMPPPPQPNPFSSPQSLFNYLQPRLPPHSFTSWGTKPGTKNLHNLWLELASGESSLSDSTPPIRTVHVVTVQITNPNGNILIESGQELSDGTIRTRSRPLSEKMKPGESVEEAVFRAVREELGSVVLGVRIVPDSYKEKVEEREESVSYPGLPGCYVLHSVEASVEGLPDDEEFCTEEVGEYDECSDAAVEVADKAVFVKKHFWKWVAPANST